MQEPLEDPTGVETGPAAVPHPPRSLRVICNYRAREDADLQLAIEELQSRGHDAELIVGESDKDARELAANAARAGFDAVVAAGGDGTLNQVVNGVMSCTERDCAVGVLPYGTGNDFATVCGVPAGAPSDALAIITHGTAQLVDVGQVNGEYFINSVTGGAPADATAEASQQAKSFLGGFAYMITGLKTMISQEPSFLRVSGGDFFWEGEAFALFVANCRTAGGGYRIGPHALLDDGLLDLTIVPASSFDQFLALVEDLVNMESTREREQLVTAQIRDVQISAPGGFRINLDGEPQSAEFYRVRVAERKLAFYLPKTAPLRVLQAQREAV